MKILIIALAVIFVTVLILLLKKTYIEINIKNSDVLVKIGGRKLRIYLYDNKKKPIEKANAVKSEVKLKAIIKKAKVLKEFYKKEKYSIKLLLLTLRERIKVQKADVSVKFGFTDAATTGIANGAIWSVLTLLFKITDKFINIKPVLNTAVVPVYTNKCFEYDIKIIISVRIVKLIKPLTDAYRILKRNKVLLNSLREGE